MIVEFFLNLSQRQRLLIFGAILGVYLVLSFMLRIWVDMIQLRSFGLLVILMGGLLFGVRGGMLVGIFLVISSLTLLLLIPGYLALPNLPTNLLTSVLGILLGAAAGSVSSQTHRFHHELGYRRRIEKQLKEHEQRYLGFFNQTTDAILVADLELRIIDTNKRASVLLGYSRDELLATTLPAILAAAPPEGGLSRAFEDTGLVFEQGLLAKNGDVIPVEFSIQRIFDEGGTPVQIQCLARDIRERRRAQSDHLRLEAEQQRGHILNQFMRDASHDFKTPLSVINTSIYLLVRDPDPANIEQRAEIIQRQVKQIDSLLDNMMVMVRLDEQTELSTEPTQINQILQQVYLVMQAQAQAAKVSLSLAVDHEIPVIRANASWLEMAVSRIVTNALQFTPEGGEIYLLSYMDGDHIAIEIQDTGVGIAADDLARIWDSFYRVDKARSSASGGSGLGLPIAQKIIQRHHGEIKVVSKVGQGSTFTILLPLPEATSIETAPLSSSG